MSQSNPLFTKSFTIAEGGQVSDIVYVGEEFSIVGVKTDLNWTEADISFEASNKNSQTLVQGGSIDDLMQCVDGGGVALLLKGIGTGVMVCTGQDLPLMPGSWFRITSSVTQDDGPTVVTVIYRAT